MFGTQVIAELQKWQRVHVAWQSAATNALLCVLTFPDRQDARICVQELCDGEGTNFRAFRADDPTKYVRGRCNDAVEVAAMVQTMLTMPAV